MVRDLLPVTKFRTISRASATLADQITAVAIRDEHGAFLYDQERQYISADEGTAMSAGCW